MAPSTVSSHTRFLQTRYFRSLDGLRAVSVLMVLAFHSADPIWEPLRGYLGVTIFFVISGFLITTLLLREEDRDGHISLVGFYIRRIFRIVPLYVVALACFSVGVFVGVASGGGNYGARAVHFLTFTNEFAGLGTFAHSWSLGIEEKFYILWPLLAFVFVALVRRRVELVALLLVVATGSLAFTDRSYPAVYAPVLIGCALAFAMHNPASFRWLEKIASGPALLMMFATAAVSLTVFDPQGYVAVTNIPFAVAVALLFPAVVLGGNWLARALAIRPLVHYGTVSYGVYLFHPFSIDFTDRFLAPGSSLPVQLARFVLIAGLTLAVAVVLHRLIEAPMVALGHRLGRKRNSIPAVADAAPATGG
jgi:peptidoglycan/LPS O-acetylase OafA/YrhL